MEQSHIELRSIAVRNRVRRNLGDLSSLMASMRRHGLMNPIVVNQRHELIAGHRRLESAKRLGWERIPALVIDGEDSATQLEIEIEENTQRKNLTSDELAEAYFRLDRLRNPSLFRRIWDAVRRFFARIFGRET